MQSVYKAQLDRLIQEDIITEDNQHTEWVNFIVLVTKQDESIRLCLNPKDLHKAIKRNQWYTRTLDDILPHLSKVHTITLNNATSGYWYVTLNLQSSLLTTFNTPWGKFWWLRLPFALKLTSDVFQERLDKVIRLLPGVIGIADDILTHESKIKEHDGRVIALFKTAKQNNLTLNSKKMQFRSQDCKFFRHRLTPKGLKVDSDKVSAITQIKPPDTIQDLRSFLGMVNYLNRFDPTLLELTEPLRRLCKQNMMWSWDSQQETVF